MKSSVCNVDKSIDVFVKRTVTVMEELCSIEHELRQVESSAPSHVILAHISFAQFSASNVLCDFVPTELGSSFLCPREPSTFVWEVLAVFSKNSIQS